MAQDLPTAAQLKEMMMGHAKASKELMASITVASGAVVGGPRNPPPTPTNPAPGATQ